MQLLHPSWHRSLDAVHLALAREQAALERQLNLATRLVHDGANDKQPIAAPELLVPRRVAAAHGNGRGRLLDNLKVVDDARSLFVGALGQLLPGPEVMRRLRAAVFPL